jgi:plastocyanin
MSRFQWARRWASVALLGPVLAVAAGLGIARSPAGASAEAAASIQIENFRFEPPELVVKKGSTVTWVNRDEEIHAVVAGDGAFSSPGLDTDVRYAHEFDEPGTYPYRCALHPQMKGTIVVR